MKKLLFITCCIGVFNYYAQAQCTSGDCKNGDGIYLLPSGAKYIGDFVNGEIEGYGTLINPNGSKYQGDWVKRLPDGWGTKTYKDGTVRTGYWKKGQPVDENGNIESEFVEKEAAIEIDREIQSGCILGDCMDSKGTFAYPNSSLYQGDFKNGKPHGWGVYTYYNGNQFTGNFKEGLPDGEGEMKYTNGTKQQGRWENGEFVGNKSITNRQGCISGNCLDGKGVYVYADGKGRYEGTFKDGREHGRGTIYYENGDRYEGEMFEGQLTGYGKFIDAYQRATSGYWKQGKYMGKQKSLPKETTQHNQATSFIASPKEVKIWAVIVGIAGYNHMPVLRYTDDDAYRMYAFFKSPEGGALPDENIRILIDEDATKDKILDSMEEVYQKAGKNDLVVLYFSGHGLRGAFLPIDYDGFNNKIYHEEINDILQKSDAKFKLCIADACHSGSLLSFTERSGKVESILSSYYELLSNAEPGTALIMSSKSEETSLESNSLRQGVFSHFLIRGLKGEADVNRDQVVTIRELFQFTSKNVSDYTGHRQTPIIKGSFDRRMPVAVVR